MYEEIGELIVKASGDPRQHLRTKTGCTECGKVLQKLACKR